MFSILPALTWTVHKKGQEFHFILCRVSIFAGGNSKLICSRLSAWNRRLPDIHLGDVYPPSPTSPWICIESEDHGIFSLEVFENRILGMSGENRGRTTFILFTVLVRICDWAFFDVDKPPHPTPSHLSTCHCFSLEREGGRKTCTNCSREIGWVRPVLRDLMCVRCRRGCGSFVRPPSRSLLLFPRERQKVSLIACIIRQHYLAASGLAG